MHKALFFRPFLLVASALLIGNTALAVGLSDLLGSTDTLLSGVGSLSNKATSKTSLSEAQIASGLKEALTLGSKQAVSILGKQGGFLNDKTVRIPLPDTLNKIGKGLRAAGQGQYVYAFENALNGAAEQAIPLTLAIVTQTIQNMTLTDVQTLLTGGNDVATQFLRQQAGDQLQQAIKPIVAQATERTGVTSAYKKMLNQGGGAGGTLIGGLASLLGQKQSSLDLDEYVTNKAMDGLFLKLAAEEQAIRENPLARSTDLLKKVFSK